MNITQEMKVAFVRGVAAAVIAGALALFADLSIGERDAIPLIAAFAVPFLTVLAWRFGLEGTYDSRRANKA